MLPGTWPVPVTDRQHHSIQLSFEQVKQLISIQEDIKKLKGRKPRIEYDVSETSQKISLVLQSYSSEIESYRELRNFVSRTRNIFGAAQKEKLQLEKIWQEFEFAYRNTTKKLSEMKQTLDNHLESSKNSWEWTKKTYEKLLNTGYKNHQKIEKELEQITDLDVTVKQAVGMCKRLDDGIADRLEDTITKLESIREQQEEFSNRRYELEASTQRTTMFSITPKDSDLIRQLCQYSEKAMSRQGVVLALDLAQDLLSKTLSRDEAVRIINNQGLYIENQENDGNSQVSNVGRDMYQYHNPPTE